MSRISLDQARTVIAAALMRSKELGLKPLSVAVLDAGGHLIAFERQDGASNLRPQIAVGKASGALALGVSSRKIGDMAAERPTFVAALGTVSQAGIIPAAGGVLVVDDTGLVIGAVGITGDTSDNDETCALAGIAAANLGTQIP
ncbi:GlcG/HbpS family heme-binding protein [Sphingosinicella microcystinivorans]|uniref:GlcG/HbpS family heme-binding protein n=1 Tax=Sphingosinicella microcystinivorans TaxID=335406 RepID=UPI0022F388E1|nr:heme-binding protein [Sphingosinicella microcystinivorans]WBX84432.1 heme-binding protein [Sphingosinicella microcystinivorans]